jgi:hypothetical protein
VGQQLLGGRGGNVAGPPVTNLLEFADELFLLFLDPSIFLHDVGVAGDDIAKLVVHHGVVRPHLVVQILLLLLQFLYLGAQIESQMLHLLGLCIVTRVPKESELIFGRMFWIISKYFLMTPSNIATLVSSSWCFDYSDTTEARAVEVSIDRKYNKSRKL